ncbi:hypothetical protein BDM02DRAFT_3117408 [Thelephora ganbajun]|uniref:Uncharacterized protein n=1 Tax=Thelephora ganbajun TaxID=370292 RepID=A0ACB6ZCZ3_THEGA|nr:hypothetical protein BDM02DRAFT_3117408 [Thelephora ganbajun]
MSFQDRPSKGTLVLKNWLRGLLTRRRVQVQGEPVNQTSLIFQLPDEIFINIFSNFFGLRLEYAYYRIFLHNKRFMIGRYFGHGYETRRRVLLAFTQLCRSTRRKFLPWLWEHVQSLCVCLTALDEQGCRRLAVKVFQGQSRTLVATPSLAVHVKILSVCILRSDAPELAELLPLLPNLDTLEVVTEGYEKSESIERTFKSVKLPRIRTLVIDADAHYLMECCTSVKRVIIHLRGSDPTYLKSIPFVADSLVYLALHLPGPEIIQDLVRLCPNLEELGIIQPHGSHVANCITAAQGFTKLRLLEVVLPRWLDFYPSGPRPVWELQMKEHAINVLGSICGHTKILKMISLARWEGDRHMRNQVITVP